MAITSIWSVKGWLSKTLIYVENPEKTENPEYIERQGMTGTETQRLTDVIDYASQSQKTQLTDENTALLRRFVSGVNCEPETARDEMMAAKKKFGKDGGVVAYHGIQSFAPGEATPEMAHEIGVKLANRLWGDKYQVLVTTHLDKSNHLHSHFVVNTVSWIDGIRYHRTARDYWLMQQESDKLCREYGLSVIEEPIQGKAKHYAEWKADKEGKPTYRSIVKADFDLAVLESMTERQLWDNLKKKGYQIKYGQDITLRPPGKERGLKLYRNFGEGYSIEAIRKRILANTRPRLQIPPERKQTKQMQVRGKLNRTKKITGLKALYFSYLYKMGVLPKKRQLSPKRVYFLFREDIRFVQRIARETRLLVKHDINTSEQLKDYKNRTSSEIISLSSVRKKLRNQTRGIKDETKLSEVKMRISELSAKISELRKEVKLCEDIDARSAEMRDKLDIAAKENTSKEVNRQNELFGRRR